MAVSAEVVTAIVTVIMLIVPVVVIILLALGVLAIIVIRVLPRRHTDNGGITVEKRWNNGRLMAQ